MADEARALLKQNPHLVHSIIEPESLLDEATSLIDKKLRLHANNNEVFPADASVRQRIIAENKDILELLMAQGAPKKGSYHAMFRAVQLPDTEIAEMLLNYGAETTNPSACPWDLYEILEMGNCPRKDEMAALLRKYHAKEADFSKVKVDLTNEIEGLKSRDEKIRWMTAYSLAWYGKRGQQAVPALIEVAKNDPLPYIRKVAIKALKSIDAEAAKKAQID